MLVAEPEPDTPDMVAPAHLVGPALSSQWQSSRYGEDRRPNVWALAASIGIVGVAMPALLTISAISAHKEKTKLSVVDVHLQQEPPPPPPPQQPQPKPVPQVLPPPAIVAPVPLVQTVPSPVQVATTPTPPPPQVSVPGPPAPAPAPAPAIANAGDLSSTMISATPPRYPHDSRRLREQGTVVLMVLLGVDGRVADISVAQSSGFARLDQAALAAVRRWRWSPTMRGGTAVMVKGLVEIPFILQER